MAWHDLEPSVGDRGSPHLSPRSLSVNPVLGQGYPLDLPDGALLSGYRFLIQAQRAERPLQTSGNESFLVSLFQKLQQSPLRFH